MRGLVGCARITGGWLGLGGSCGVRSLGFWRSVLVQVESDGSASTAFSGAAITPMLSPKALSM
jgi:hypothetical protein